VVTAALVSAGVHADVIELDPSSAAGRRGLASDARYVELNGTADETLTRALAAPRSEFLPLPRRYIDFGATPNALWLLLDVRNASDEPGRWHMSLNVRFMTDMIVYQRSAAGGEVLLNQTRLSTFAERPEPRRVLSVPFRLAGGEDAEIFVGYRSDGTTTLPLSIETDTSFTRRYDREDAVYLACYAAVAFLAALSLLQAMIFRQRSQLSYALYLCATLLYIVHMDGWTFQFVWPGSPLWNSYAAIPLGLAMSASALLFVRGFTEMRTTAPVVDKLLLTLIGLACVASFGGVVVPERTMKGIAYLLASTTAAACLGAAVLAHLRQQPAMRFLIVGWIGVFTGVLLTSIANNFPGLIAPTTAVLLPKFTILFDALMFYTALGDRARAWRTERDHALRGELQALRAQQQATDDLHRAERERLEALLLAQTRSRQLAMASHDIRQPLTSLRLALEKMPGVDGAPLASAYGARQSLDYLEGLADQYGADLTATEAAIDHNPAKRDFALGKVLDNVELMFRDEAEAKGLRFRCRGFKAHVLGDAMSAMRLISNLVANAIKYTDSGKILIGCRRLAGSVRLVVADTGSGIDPEELTRVLQAGERGKAAQGTDGQGLGLAIATALAEQNGYRFDCRSEPGRGTVFSIEIPLAGAERGVSLA
jgi:signal transduction histidine kinase